jgi:hypothetical protein
MKRYTATSVVAFTLLIAPLACRSADQPAYEYRVMSLVEMFDGTPDVSKVGEMAVKVNGVVQRNDMDAADYQKALNRIAAQGWELVTVNKSNYWVFRRTAKSDPK